MPSSNAPYWEPHWDTLSERERWRHFTGTMIIVTLIRLVIFGGGGFCLTFFLLPRLF